ncbi:tetratricopeptide repeat protein [Bosea sp. 117]|uniref:tetratricopeptide repeat protein n=1 Tax=Bosea sp. 117 TaxID=1125973 RepID=UPI000ABB1FEA|nr:tetratricopeptide repeat protein [Bosea sp. 117]
MPDEWISYPALKRMGADELSRRIAEGPREAARWVEAGALNGLVNAQIAWGQMLADGHGVARDRAAALRWFTIASTAGHLDGTNMVGRCHELGWGTPVDKAEAARRYRAAAEKGHAWAQFNLATLLLHGEGVAADRRAALLWYARAARGGNGKAATMIGRYLEQGWDRPARPAAALRWYRRGAASGDYRGQFDYGRLLAAFGRGEEALGWLHDSIENGVPDFCRQAAAGLRESDDARIRRLALRALERACLSGAASDLRAHAAALAKGLGVPPDPAAAAERFAEARRVETQPPPSEPAIRRPKRISRLRRLLAGMRPHPSPDEA